MACKQFLSISVRWTESQPNWLVGCKSVSFDSAGYREECKHGSRPSCA